MTAATLLSGLLASLASAALSGCGQKGPLTLSAPTAGRPAAGSASAVPVDAAALPASSVSPTALPASQQR